MHFLTAARQRVELLPVDMKLETEAGQVVVRAAGLHEYTSRLSRAVRAFFDVPVGPQVSPGLRAAVEVIRSEPPLALFRDKDSGLLRLVHKEIVLRFVENTPLKIQEQLLAKHHLEIQMTNEFVPNQFIVKVKQEKHTGQELIAIANACMETEEVAFATPNFISEYRRQEFVIPVTQWHLKNTAAIAGQTVHEDVKAAGAWAITQGKRTIIIAILDDGVDIEHPNLKSNILKNPDPNQPLDLVGRDFFIPDNANPEHFNPRPKNFQYPYDQMAGNDIHGTPCAGVVAATGKQGVAWGIAPKCRILAVKIFHGDNLSSDARVADAIRYAALHADVLSCSWSGGHSTDIELAIRDAGTLGRKGKGSTVFCAAGNDYGKPVGFPASLPDAVAVGASTDQAMHANYSNIGKEIWVVAPSSGGKQGIYTTDVSTPNRGFNLGTDAAGGKDGLHTNSFGGTSSATPLAAGVAALMLSVKPSLTRDQVRDVLKDTADKIGTDHNPKTGHSNAFGYGRVNAEAAIKTAKAMP